VSASEIKTGGGKAETHESMLLRVNGALAITNDIPDGATGKFFEFVITGDLRVDDTIYTHYGTPDKEPDGGAAEYPPHAYRNGAAFNEIRGVLYYSFSNTKLLPRGATDLVRTP